jgi:hypothetical protein
LTFLQLYNEKIYDMMAFNNFSEHKLRWNSRDMFFVEGLISTTVQNAQEAV